MKVYDFDKTIFYPDSSVTFIRFCFRKMPLRVLRALFSAIPKLATYKLRHTDAAELKERLFSFLKDKGETQKLVQDFWAEYSGNLEPWYLKQHEPEDVIISASPEFLLQPAAEKFGFTLLGTRMDPATGKITGRNCHDSEKVIRFRALFPHTVPDAFYSDSLSDTPMAEISETAFLVKHGRLNSWPSAARHKSQK